MQRVQRRIERVAALDAAVLLRGESGTGKEVVAREISRLSVRERPTFVPVNCGAIAESLIESELFGHRRGAFTHALADRRGLVEQAHRGVLFLDEIGEMPIAMQASLLRFLDSGEFRRVGDETVKFANVRIIAATNRPLESDIRSGRFRLDLFHRLNVVSIYIPPLRERREDIPALARLFLRCAAGRLGIPPLSLTDDAATLLRQQPWPGNIRELQNVIENAAVFVSSEVVTALDVQRVLSERHVPDRLRRGDDISIDTEIEEALDRFRGNSTRAAEALGISRTTLWRRRRRSAANVQLE